MLRSILIFPDATALPQIETFRRRYDPLYTKIKPHITLVFPFESYLSDDEIHQHLADSAIGVKPFNFTFGAPQLQKDGYVWMPVVENADLFHELHGRLCRGVLAEYLRRDIPYIPHLTVGCIDLDKDSLTTEEMTAAFPLCNPAQATALAMEQILPDESSFVTGCVLL